MDRFFSIDIHKWEGSKTKIPNAHDTIKFSIEQIHVTVCSHLVGYLIARRHLFPDLIDKSELKDERKFLLVGMNLEDIQSKLS